MLKKIIFFVNFNLYESKRYFTSKLCEAFARKGIETHIIDVNESPIDAHTISNIVRQQPQLTCSFNSILPIKEDFYLWDELEIPHLSMLVDPAIYSLDLVKSPYSLISCVDHYDCKMMVDYGAKNVFFFPHGIERELNFDPNADRPYDIVFLGSCYDIDAIRNRWENLYPKEIGEAIIKATEITLAESNTPFFNAYKRVNDSHLLDTDILSLVDFYSRGKDRIELINSIKNAKVHVFGDVQMGEHGWNKYLMGNPNVILHPPVSYKESLEILKKSKICLNSMPFFKNGSHERIFAALACGAVPITSANQFVQDHFNVGQDLMTYQNGEWEEMNKIINELLSHKNNREIIVSSGRNKVMENHTWDVRAEQLMNEIPKILLSMI